MARWSKISQMISFGILCSMAISAFTRAGVGRFTFEGFELVHGVVAGGSECTFSQSTRERGVRI